jgi:tRNA-(ms[2]io[6]A)-hydroxylase
MFRIQQKTDTAWVKIAESNVQEILTDHAYCEQKAASSAISIIVQYPEYPEIVQKMSELAQEEMSHFQRVHQFILKRGYKLGKERKDSYVNELLQFIKKGESREKALVDRLLLGAMIEARSCERFKILSENIDDAELATFYRELMESEAGHYTLFITLARNVLPREYVDNRWLEWLSYEETIIAKYGHAEKIHG